MADSHSFTNCYITYFKNGPYHYPANSTDAVSLNNQINTGWHILPNMLWRHLVTPKQWAEFQMNYEAYHVDSISCTVFNPVPMTTQLAIQGTTAFTAFNNTIYSMGYTDSLYETNWFEWNKDGNDELNLCYKEGLIQPIGSSTQKRYELPVYIWKPPNARADNASVFGRQGQTNSKTVYPLAENYIPSGVFWDPMNRPDHLMELRPGKNSMNFGWECHSCDSDVWFNLDQLASWAPYCGDWAWDGMSSGPPDTERLSGEIDPEPINDGTIISAPGTVTDYTWPNMADWPVVPMNWFWMEMAKSIAVKSSAEDRKVRLKALGTEYQEYKYGPTQWFVKGLPLFDENNTHIETTTQVCVKMTLNLTAKKRRSAIYAPTWGPFAWKTLYSSTSWTRNMPPSAVRYRTGGARRTMSNLAHDGDWGLTATWSPKRETPYIAGSTWSGTGTSTTMTTSVAGNGNTTTK
nr:MAG: capsid protein [Duck parvovirus]